MNEKNMIYGPDYDLELEAEQIQKPPFLVIDPGTLASSFYLPAMMGINTVKEYGQSSFLRAQMVLGAEMPQIVCFVRYISPILIESVLNSDNFSHREEFSDNNTMVSRIFYNVPPDLYEDYQLFCSGSYSKISQTTRERIILISGLRYRVAVGDKFIYDKKLLVLDKSIYLRNYIEEFLDVKIDEEAELLDIPGRDNYYIV